MKAMLLGLILGLPVLAVAATPHADATFYKDAAEGGLAEVELGKLAQAKGATPAVKDFGAMMVADHSAANAKLAGIAAGKNIDLPKSPSVSQMATKGKLKLLSGDAFDKAYIKAMITDHQDDIAMFKKEAESGQDPDAKAYAVATLPTLEEHLKKIQSIAGASGVSAN